MEGTEVHQLGPAISCHVWNGDNSCVALCPNNSELHIYDTTNPSKWACLHVLNKHDQLVSGVDWGAQTNRIVTCSHDRNAYVWNLEEGNTWTASLVILRFNRAALCIKWSPHENKFAVGSGAKTVSVCYYEPENDWWVSKLIKKRHGSSVTSVAWHPQNVLLATTSTDGRCRIFAAGLKNIDLSRDGSSTSRFGDSKFGEQLLELDVGSGWAVAARWSPSGDSLAFAGHDSTLHVLSNLGNASEDLVAPQIVYLRDLPFLDLTFFSETLLLGVGFDCTPMLFSRDKESGLWSLLRSLESKGGVGANASKDIGGGTVNRQFLDARGKFEELPSRGGGPLESALSRHRHHRAPISCVAVLASTTADVIRVSTSGLDGRIVVWSFQQATPLPEVAGLEASLAALPL
eukprot:TRINITY_DN9090_c0_g1_i1.p1 TRINITY_DN9090_c0_g1~~TRINITY_DN9090_c0_g1_i1.p1  ORF type:complete len:403 (-),score=47.19 TRINITY_DN9090_c0_g1_i1:1032-2240(-)